MGEPNLELDKLWYDLAKLRNYDVDYDTLASINRTQAAVEYPGTGEYQVGLEVFHQLHCLNYLRMYSYKNCHSAIDFDMIAEPEEERKKHKDHCVEVLRQRLMCNPDLNIYSHH
ncbi:hypothetical protein J3458_012960 [Metarhizium acridum]|uniref:uncharacterized protein n=1 Tax=Metarhizium acridum TaxID=92637 RepID=UPI001C6AD2EE|nr:hypothetical protein J3458_012960 [Metarhizium acridum]